MNKLIVLNFNIYIKEMAFYIGHFFYINFLHKIYIILVSKLISFMIARTRPEKYTVILSAERLHI
ncbi:hypothetical protein KQ44_00825 [Brachyspira sp. G79]|nr:hypothetical protein KQ44_00825 [Brachyspira sp. G79]